MPISRGRLQSALILVVEDIEEVRDSIETLLLADGYVVASARNEEDAVLRACQRRPDLILMSLGDVTSEAIAAAMRIRNRAGLSDIIPIVIFCCPIIAEGTTVEREGNVYLTRPDNFNQLRECLHKLVSSK